MHETFLLSSGIQWIHEDFVAKKAQKGKRAKGVVNMSLGGTPGQVGSADEVRTCSLANLQVPPPGNVIRI